MVEVAEVNKVVRVVEVIEVIRVVEVIKVVELVERKNKRLPHFKREAASKFLHLGSRSEGRKARRADFPSDNIKHKLVCISLSFLQSIHVILENSRAFYHSVKHF